MRWLLLLLLLLRHSHSETLAHALRGSKRGSRLLDQRSYTPSARPLPLCLRPPFTVDARHPTDLRLSRRAHSRVTRVRKRQSVRERERDAGSRCDEGRGARVAVTSPPLIYCHTSGRLSLSLPSLTQSHASLHSRSVRHDFLFSPKTRDIICSFTFEDIQSDIQREAGDKEMHTLFKSADHPVTQTQAAVEDTKG